MQRFLPLLLTIALLTGLFFSVHSQSVSIHADFEGGRLGEITHVADNQWQCALLGESDSENRNIQSSWYYFRVDGSKNKPLTIELTELVGEYNYRYGNVPLKPGTRPLVSYDQIHWQHLSDEQVRWNEADTTLTMSFTPQENTLWVAHVVPYTTRPLEKLLAEYRAKPQVVLDTMGLTPEGRPLWLMTVTNPEVPVTKKNVVWLMARQHSWESGTSWIMEGLIRYLLDSDQGRKLLDRSVFKLIPMGDPDGVARGGVRFNAFGHDLNRNWDYVIPEEMPEIAAQKQAMQEWLAQGNPMDLFITLHNTNADYIEGPETPVGRKLWKEMLQSSLLDIDKGLRIMPASTTLGKLGRMSVIQALWADHQVPSYVVEFNVAKVEKLGRLRTLDDWLAIGPRLAEAMGAAVRK